MSPCPAAPVEKKGGYTAVCMNGVLLRNLFREGTYELYPPTVDTKPHTIARKVF